MAERKPEARGGGAPLDRRLDAHVLIVEARYYEEIADALIEGAVAEIEAHGCTYERIAVPGALEIPQVVAMATDASGARLMDNMLEEATNPREFDGVVAIGCVIRGETSHYDIVCHNANHWLMHHATLNDMPVGNAILTVDTREQAMARAAGGREGKGGDAARACLRLIEVARRFAEVG
jgi:6,7-dimethyl-8-ribityllumazine synthase